MTTPGSAGLRGRPVTPRGAALDALQDQLKALQDEVRKGWVPPPASDNFTSSPPPPPTARPIIIEHLPTPPPAPTPPPVIPEVAVAPRELAPANGQELLELRRVVQQQQNELKEARRLLAATEEDRLAQVEGFEKKLEELEGAKLHKEVTHNCCAVGL